MIWTRTRLVRKIHQNSLVTTSNAHGVRHLSPLKKIGQPLQNCKENTLISDFGFSWETLILAKYKPPPRPLDAQHHNRRFALSRMHRSPAAQHALHEHCFLFSTPLVTTCP